MRTALSIAESIDEGRKVEQRKRAKEKKKKMEKERRKAVKAARQRLKEAKMKKNVKFKVSNIYYYIYGNYSSKTVTISYLLI